jgi:hypothetical protein
LFYNYDPMVYRPNYLNDSIKMHTFIRGTRITSKKINSNATEYGEIPSTSL